MIFATQSLFQFHPGMYQSNLGHSIIPQAAPMQYLPQMNPNYMPQQVFNISCIGFLKNIRGNVLESNTG